MPPANLATPGEVNRRVILAAQSWGVTIERAVTSAASVHVYGTRGNDRVMIKVTRQASTEWLGGAVTAAFGGRAVVQALERAPGVVLLECLDPGTSLATLALSGRDDEATEILATVVRQMSPQEPPAACPTAEAYGAAFTRYLANSSETVPRSLVEYAQRVHHELCFTERNPSLLHGDLHHSNVLFDKKRGWTAIDPKGVVGELEYELGAALRSPVERPDLFGSLTALERRLAMFGTALGIDVDRARGWAFAQTVLALLWRLEDDTAVAEDHPYLVFAQTLAASSALRAHFEPPGDR